MSNMKLITSQTINGKVVQKDHVCGNMIVYKEVLEEPIEAVLYFVRGEDVVMKIKVQADMSQGVGYIDTISYKNYK